MSRIADYSRDFWIALGLVVAFYLLRAAVRAVVRFGPGDEDER